MTIILLFLAPSLLAGLAMAQESAIRAVAPLPTPTSGAAAVWDGSGVLVFGGRTPSGETDAILRYDPSSNTWTTRAAKLPAPGQYLSTVWTGSEALVFGLGDRIVSYDPTADAVRTLDYRLPSARTHAGVAWTGAAAYLFGGTSASGRALDEIVKVDPSARTARLVDQQLEAPTSHAAAVWTGTSILVFPSHAGSVSERGSTWTFDPKTSLIRTSSYSFPIGQGFAATFDGTHAYVFGGQATEGYYESPIRWAAGGGGQRLNDHPFGPGRASIAAAWSGDTVYLVGGENENGPLTSVVRYKPSLIPGGAQPKPVAMEARVAAQPLGSTHENLPTGLSIWGGGGYSARGTATRCDAGDPRGDEHVQATARMLGFDGTVAGSGDPIGQTGHWDVLVAHAPGELHCSGSGGSVTLDGQTRSDLGILLGFNLSRPPTALPEVTPLGPGTTFRIEGTAEACRRHGDSVAIAGFTGTLTGRDTAVPARQMPSQSATTTKTGSWDLVIARDVASLACTTEGVLVTGPTSGFSPNGIVVGIRFADTPSPASPTPRPTPTPTSTPADPPTTQPTPTTRTPCYDLLSCPIGDLSSLRARITSVAGRLQTPTGAALVGAPIFLLGESEGALKLLGTTVTNEDGTFTAPPMAVAPTYAATLLGGHIVMQDLLRSGDIPTDGRLTGLTFPIPAQAARADLAGMTQQDALELAATLQDAKPFGVPRVGPSASTLVPTAGYAGIDEVHLQTRTDAEDARLMLMRLTGKGSARIPDPPEGRVSQWFAAQVTDLDGRELPIQLMSIRFRVPDASAADTVFLHHFRLDSQTWETITAERLEDGSYVAQVPSLSLFAVARTQPTALGAVVQTVGNSPYTLPTLGGMLVIGIAAVAMRKLRAATSGRAKPRQGPSGEAALRVAALPEKEALVSGLRVDVKETKILKDVSFAFNQGDILALLGPSGSGKSTLLKALLGEMPYEGEIHLFGIDPSRAGPDLKKLVGYVSQETELYPDMTLRENVEYFGKQYGLSAKEAKERTPALLETLGLADRINTRVGLLSGGQQRRASIAATLVAGPSLLILDEPTSGLDPVTRKSLWKFVRQANRDMGVTVVVTTHFLDEAELADRVIILHGGAVVKSGAPQDLVRSLPGGGRAVVVELQTTSPAIEARVREAVAPLMTERVVSAIDLSGYNARFFTQDAQTASRRLLDAFARAEVPVKQVTTEDCGMDAVFTYYAGERWKGADE